MSSDNENDLSAIAWPGFVDILSAVIIMFVFFVMVVATALYFHIIIFKSQILANPESSQIKIESEIKDVVAQTQTQFAESKEQDISLNSEDKSITVFFGRDSISLLQTNHNEIKTFIEEYIDKNASGNSRITIVASKNPDALQTAARKVALARMLNVRNAVLQSGFDPEAIEVKVINGELVDDTYHWVTIRIIE